MLRYRMNFERLQAAVEASARVCDTAEVIVVGPGALYGTIAQRHLRGARLPNRVDVFIPLMAEYTYNGEHLRRELGERSNFQARARVVVRPVYVEQLRLPSGWRDRLVARPVNNAVGLCADPHDVCASMLVAHAPAATKLIERLAKNREIDPTVLQRRVQLMNLHDMQSSIAAGMSDVPLSLTQAGEMASRLQRYVGALLPEKKRPS